MTANAQPIPIDDPLVSLEVRPFNNKLAEVLNKISNTVSINAKALVEVVDSVNSLRRVMDHQAAKIAKLEQNHKEQQHHVSVEMSKLARDIDTLSSTCAYKSEVHRSFDEVWTQVQSATEFIEEVESGSGERVSRFVKNYIDGYLPKWWEGIDKKLWGEIISKIDALRDSSQKKMEQRVGSAEERFRTLVTTTKSGLVDQQLSLTEERRRDLQKFREHTASNFADLKESMRDSDRALEIEIERLEERANQKIHNVDHKTTALRHTMCFEEGMAEELMSASGGEEARCNLTVEEAAVDVRVARIQRTPHFLYLRTTIQREINDRMELLKSEVHQDLTVEMFDMQKELKGKVTTGKMPELLEAHRDQGLYSNVRDLLGEAQELKRNKLDSIVFLDALKSKADIKALDNKVDRQTMNHTVEGVGNRVDTVETDMARMAERLKQSQKQLEDLQILVITGRPPNRDFPVTSTVAEILEGNIKDNVETIMLEHMKEKIPGDVIIEGSDSRDVQAERASYDAPKPPPSSGLLRGGMSSGRAGSAGGRGGKSLHMVSPRIGSAKPGQQVKGLTQSVRKVSAGNARAGSIVTTQQQSYLAIADKTQTDAGVDDLSPGPAGSVMGLTNSQQAYVHMMGGSSDGGDTTTLDQPQWKQPVGSPQKAQRLLEQQKRGGANTSPGKIARGRPNTTGGAHGRKVGGGLTRLGGNHASRFEIISRPDDDPEIPVREPFPYQLKDGVGGASPPLLNNITHNTSAAGNSELTVQNQHGGNINGGKNDTSSATLPNIHDGSGGGGGGGAPLGSSSFEEGAGMNALVYEGRTTKGGGKGKIALEGTNQ